MPAIPEASGVAVHGAWARVRWVIPHGLRAPGVLHAVQVAKLPDVPSQMSKIRIAEPRGR
jgi:hypothetical protein